MPFTTFGEFIECIKNASINFTELWEMIVTLYTTITTNADIVALWDSFTGLISVVMPYMTYILIALAVIETFFGKKLMGLQKFLFFLVAGFACGVQFVSPLISGFLTIPSWIVGLVVGIVAAVLCKFLYWIVIVVFAGYSGYMVCFAGEYLPAVTQFTKGNLIISLVVAVVAIVLVLLLLKYIEMLGTAALGSLGIVSCVKSIYDFTALVAGYEWIVELVVFAIIALIGFIVQFKTRKRY